MKIDFIEIRNFRKLKSCRIDLSGKETIFVGANNSGKTSAMDALIVFLKERTKFSMQDFTLSNWNGINEIGAKWLNLPKDIQPNLTIEPWQDLLPQLDVWLQVLPNEIYYVSDIIPTLDWDGGQLGVRLRLEPKDIERLYQDFTTVFNSSAQKTALLRKGRTRNKVTLWPKTLSDFLERNIQSYFSISAYILDANKLKMPLDGIALSQDLAPDAEPLTADPFNGLIKIDIINAQRNFSDPNVQGENKPRLTGNLTAQLRDYYTKHLDPYNEPGEDDLEAIQAIESARISFDEKLSKSFTPSIKELENLNYPGFGGNPSIKISSRVNAIDAINHGAAVQFQISGAKGSDGPLSLPERYNGLGYQNLISMVFKLIRFRDEWMQVGKISKPISEETKPTEFEPLHLVLVEEPEAHLHAQVQQVFIRKAYDVLKTNPLLNTHSNFTTQLVVSTHSNHIAHEIEFTSLRYFKRIPGNQQEVPTSTVVNLSTTFGDQSATTKFATRYLRTTHCDLFFADAVILIEGPAERMLVPHFIKHHYPQLSTCYIAILEIGGSHSHTLRPLLEELGITTLIITDLDSINPVTNKSAVYPEKGKKYISGNYTLTHWLPSKNTLDALLAANPVDKLSKIYPFRVAYQCPLQAKLKGDKNFQEVIPYTFEVALVFKNLDRFQKLDGKGLLKKMSDASKLNTAAEANRAMFDALASGKKAEFALDLLFNEAPEALLVPDYIAEGLEWLHSKLITQTPKSN